MFQGLWFLCKFGWNSEKRYILYNVFYQLIQSILPLIAVAVPKYILNELLGAQRLEKIILYISILAGCTFFATCASQYLFYGGFSYRIKVGNDFSKVINKKLAEVDFKNLESPAFWDLKERAGKFLYADWHGFSYLLDSALNIFGSAVTLVGVIAIVAALNAWVMFLFMALMLASAAVESWAKKNGMQVSMECVPFERSFMYYSELFSQAGYGKEIRLYGLGGWLLFRLKKHGENVYKCYRRRNHFFIKSGFFTAFMTLIQQGVAYAYLVEQVIAGGMAIGDFTMYIAAVTTFSSALRACMGSFVEVKAYGPYYQAMKEYQNMPDAMRQNRKQPVPNGAHKIEFRNVTFRYPGQDRPALKHVSIVLEPGEKLALVGENGAGKTTFIKLLLRLYDPDEGEILLDGVNVRDLAYEAYESLFSTVFQDYKLFAFSLKENVAFGAQASDAEVEALLRRVDFGERLDTLPKGVHTSVTKQFDETGFEPSGGEAQRIVLARALYKDAPVIVLDEPAAALDPRAEAELYCHFDELVKGKTAVYISHRLSSTKFCDRIAVFRGGSLVELGTHDALMQQRGVYRQLFTMQAQYYA